MAERDFDYGFDISTLVEQEMNRWESGVRQPDDVDLMVREYDEWDEEYVEFDDEVFDL